MIFMEAIILFSAIADHEEKQSLVKTVCMYLPIVGMKLRQSSENLRKNKNLNV